MAALRFVFAKSIQYLGTWSGGFGWNGQRALHGLTDSFVKLASKVLEAVQRSHELAMPMTERHRQAAGQLDDASRLSSAVGHCCWCLP